MADYSKDFPLASAVRLPEITGACLSQFVEYVLADSARMTAYPYTILWLEHRSVRLSALFLQPRLPVEHHRDGIG